MLLMFMLMAVAAAKCPVSAAAAGSLNTLETSLTLVIQSC